MDIIELKQILRSDYAVNIRPYYIKDKCEMCGSDEKLELHHKTRFIDLLNHTLEHFNINLENITEEELNNIRIYMLGIQLINKNITLCTKCHDKIHSSNKVKKNMVKKIVKYTEEEIEEYKINQINKLKQLDSKFIGVKLSSEDKNYLIDEYSTELKPRKRSWAKFKNDLYKSGYEVITTKNGSFIVRIGNSLQDEINSIDEKINIDKTNDLKKYLDNIIGKRLNKKEQEELINKIDYKVDGHQKRSYRQLNNALKDIFGDKYIIISKSRLITINKKEKK